MRTRYDQLSKSLLQDTLAVGGELHRQHEVSGEVQAVDGWFVPDPACTGALADRGLLGRMALTAPGLLEPFHEPPDIDEIRACIHKQLAVDLDRLREAERLRAPRPPFPALWVISAGRPERVLHAYGFAPSPGWPPGFWSRHEADAFGLVVVRDLPRDRSTLMLRLMGAGAVQIEAIKELQRLPRDAWERAVASRHLVALRMELPQDGSDEDREFLMNSLKLVDDMLERHGAEAMKRGREQGRNEGRLEALRQAIRVAYESRFGAMPPALVTTLEATEEPTRLEAWLSRVVVASAEDIAAALGASSPSS